MKFAVWVFRRLLWLAHFIPCTPEDSYEHLGSVAQQGEETEERPIQPAQPHRTHSVALSGEVGRRLKYGIRCCSQNEILAIGTGPPS